MCLQDHDHVQLRLCSHGAFHLRVGNTTLHLTRKQLLALYDEVNRCVRKNPDTKSAQKGPDTLQPRRLGPFLN